MIIEQISVFVENKRGHLADITEILAAGDIDLRALSIAETADFGILRLITSNPEHALTILKAAGCVVAVTPVLAIEIEDKPGSLAKVVRLLADADISVEYTYAFVSHATDHAYVIFRVEDPEKAIEIFTKQGINLARTQDIYDL